MKIRGKINRYFFVVPLFYALSAAVSFYFGYWITHQTSERIEKEIKPQIEALSNFESEVRDHVGYLEFKILQAYTSESRTLYSVSVIERQTAADKLKGVQDNDLEKAAEKDQLLAQIEELNLYRNEIVTYIDNAGTGNIEQYAKASQTYATKVIPLYHSIIASISNLKDNRKETIAHLRQWQEYSTLIAQIAITISLLVSILLAVLARKDFIKSIEDPLRKILDALPTRSKVSLPNNNEFSEVAHMINLRHAEIEEVERITNELAAGNRYVDINDSIISEKVLVGLAAVLSRLKEWQDEHSRFLAENTNTNAQVMQQIEQEKIKLQNELQITKNQLQTLENTVKSLNKTVEENRLAQNVANTAMSNTEKEQLQVELQKAQDQLTELEAQLRALLAERSEQEQKLQESNQLIIALQTAAPLERLENNNTVTFGEQVVNQHIPSFETDTEGNFIYVNDAFAKLTGYTVPELQKSNLSIFDQDIEEAETSNDIWVNVKQGKVWQGTIIKVFNAPPKCALALSVSPYYNNEGNLEKFIGTCLDATPVLAQSQSTHGGNFSILEPSTTEANPELSLALQTTQQDLEKTKAQLENLINEQILLKKGFEEQQLIKFRLAQQQAALQELARNQHLKQGNVTQALAAITETTVYAIDEDRVGLWLFTENDTRARCLDMYDRQHLRHAAGIEIAESDFIEFFREIKSESIIASADVNQNAATARLSIVYFKPNRVISVLCAPIRLGGMVVGFIMVEHIGIVPREWAFDEQNFVIATSDIVSLALEQGNRKAMEEELRVTLEESQALDEELRQNAEEIEATNEEMRRTQIELRGQISALNNAAIVAETNLKGRIIYANAEFMKVYKFSKKEVLGQSHGILKSGHHQPSFYEQMWKTINEGKVWKGEVRNQAKDGEIVWVLSTITPVLGLEGQPFKFIAVSFDITSQKLQEEQIIAALQVALEQEEMLRTNTHELLSTNDEMRKTQIELAGQIKALNNSSLVYETDMQGKITYVNEVLLTVSNYSANDLLGNHHSILNSGRHPEMIYQDQWRTIAVGRVWRGELEMKAKNDDYFWVMCTCTPVLDENSDPIKVINVLVDITAQKKQEFRLKKQQAALLELTGHPSVKEGNVSEAFRVIMRIGVETLTVTRGSIWMYEEGGKVRCTTVVQLLEQHIHGEGAVLDKEMYPVYFRTIDRERIIGANDAINDSRTKELAFTLFKPSRIVSVLDAGIRMGTNTVGLISFEQTETTREWTVDEQSFVASLADTIALVLEQKERLLADKLKQAYMQLESTSQEMHRQKEQLEEFSSSLTQGIRYAKRIQTNILPSKEIMERYLGANNFFVVHRQRDQVGGDFYWFSQMEDLRIIVIADGTGHGVPGAFLTLIGYLLLNQIVNEKKITTPADILYHLHIGVRVALKQDDDDGKSTSRDGMDMAICTLNIKTLQAQYAGANLPFYYYQDWEVVEIKPTKKSIGGEQLEEERIFQNHSIQLKTGDAFYMYTDGFVDQFGGPDNKRFSTRRFRDLILRTQHESMATQRALLNLEWKEWKEDRDQIDDVTVFGFKV